MKIFRHIVVSAAILAFFTGMVPAVFAQDQGKVVPPTINCPPNMPCITAETQKSGGQAIRDYITNNLAAFLIQTFLGLAAVTCVVLIIVGGVQMQLAFGTEDDINKAKKTVLWAVIGLLICILSVAIVRIITNISFG